MTNINVTYTMKFEDLPKEMANRFEGLKVSLEHAAEDIQSIADQLLENDDSSYVFKTIDEFRQRLADIDQKTEQYGAILAEYRKGCAEIFLANNNKHTNKEQLPLVEDKTETTVSEDINLVGAYIGD